MTDEDEDMGVERLHAPLVVEIVREPDALTAAGPQVFHLPGQHDQKTHGSRASGPSLSAIFDAVAKADRLNRSSTKTEHREAVEQLRRMVNDAVGGEHAGLTVEVATAGGYDGYMFAELDVRDADGRKVGRGNFGISTDRDGKFVVTDPTIEIDPQFQGSKFSTEWMTQIFRWASENGVDRAEITADIDVGGYAWAIGGWDWGGTDDYPIQGGKTALGGPSMIRSFLEQARSRTDLAPDVVTALDDIEERSRLPFDDPSYPTPRELALVGRAEGQGGRDARWLGKEILLGSAWSAAMRFQP